MAGLISFFHEIQFDLNKETFSRSDNLGKYLPLEKFLVEKFILEQVYEDFFAIYKKQYQDKDLVFYARTNTIRKKNT